MNGADDHLKRLESQAEHILALLHAKRIDEAQEAMLLLLGAVRDGRTLAHRENWRIVARHNGEFTRQWLNLVDGALLTDALRACSPETLDKLRLAIEAARDE